MEKHKIKDRLYAIREVSEITGINANTIRAWDKANIIGGVQRVGGKRIFTKLSILDILKILKNKK